MPKITKGGICAFCSIFVGIGLVVGGYILTPMTNSKLHSVVNQKLPILPNSYSYAPWKKPPLPIHFSIFVFDLVNPKEVVEQGAKPFFVEKGPFVYRLGVEKKNITFHDNYTVSYREVDTYHFDAEKSVGPITTKFTTVNLPMITSAEMIKNEYWYIKDLVRLTYDLDKNYPLFVELTVEELIWGYEDPFLKIVKELLGKFNIPFNDHFGFFYQLNGTDNGVFNVFTGEDDVSKVSLVDRWKGQKKLSIWTTDECNMMNGTDGNLFHPFVKKSDRLYFFTTQIQRSEYFEYDREVKDKGIDLYRFRMPDRVYYSPDKNPENEGFCMEPGKCMPSGLLDIRKLDKGAPALISQPHFLGAEQKVFDTIRGMKPNRAIHGSYIDLQPTLGIILNSQRPIQINALLQNSSVIRSTWKFKTIYFPMLWFDSSSFLTDSLADQMKDTFLKPLKILAIVQYVLYAVGGVLVLGTVLICLVRKRKVSKKIEERESVVNNIPEERRALLGGVK